MAHLSYSFCMSMLHSLWQAGLLLLVYSLSEKIFNNKTSPLQKRNWLFILLTTQLAFFAITFSIYFFNIENTVTENLLDDTVTALLSSEATAYFTPWIFGLYLAAITYKMIKALYEWRHFKQQYNRGLQKPSIDLKLFTAVKADHFGIKRKVKLWLSTTINAPVTFGFFKPVIVLPVALANQLSMQQAETLILHELTHIKANDYLLNWVLIVVEHIFFFNPFIITLCKKIRLEREKYCDSNVIAFAYSPLLYAETLLKAQHIRQHVPQYQLAAVAGKAQLLQRIQFFTNTNNFAHTKSRFAFPLLSVLFVVIFSAGIFLQCKITGTAKPDMVNITTPLNPNFAAEEATFENKFAAVFSENNLKLLTEAVQKQQPEIEKQLKKLEPMIKSIQDKAEEFAQQFDNSIVATPVVFKEGAPAIPAPATTHKIFVKEEQSGSKNATVKVYTVTLINGEWVVVPEWMLAAKEILNDSLQSKIDTSTPQVQE